MIQLAVAGAAGRTGGAVIEAAMHDPQFELVAGLVEPGDPVLPASTADDLSAPPDRPPWRSELPEACDVLVDFTVPAGTMHWLAVCAQRGIALVTGTTGLSDAQQRAVREAAHRFPIVQASNFCIGVELLRRAVREVARGYGPGVDVEIVETHHRHKRDAPSGTALRLVEDVQSAWPRGEGGEIVYGRAGAVGPRRRGEIGVHALRLGETRGRHAVHFNSGADSIVLQHEVHDRSAFAAGALQAAAWIVGRGAGLYRFADTFSR